MTADTWLDDNNRYLAASLAWLRARLQDMARDGSAPVAAVDDPSITPPTAVQPETTGNPTADSTAAARDAAAALLTLPLGIGATGSALLDPVALGLGAVVAGLSSVLPYTLELRALRRLPTPTFALLMSLGPAIAALAGYLVLGQRFSLVQVLAVGLVVTASAAAVRTAARGRTTPRTPPTPPRRPRSAAGRS